MAARSGSRSSLLEFAVLGLLQDSPMHGYELRKRLNGVLGAWRAISYGSLYPCLKALEQSGAIEAAVSADPERPTLGGKRARIVYEVTVAGKERFDALLAETGPETWEDDTFGVRLAFFGRTDATVRRRILEGRRNRLEERMSILRQALNRSSNRLDSYTLELQQHGLESVEREVGWINDLLATEASRSPQTPRPSTRKAPGA